MLIIDNLCVKYGSAQILHNVGFQVTQGDCVCIIGANGAGKTTLLKTISGIVRCWEGSIAFEGVPIEKAQPDAIIKMGIAHCPEGRRVFPAMTVTENLEVGGITNRAKTPGLIAECFKRFPRLAERAAQLAGTMSGGEQQMLAIARALMSDPKLIMFDEPSLGLAPNTVELVAEIIKELHEAGHTILLVEQNAFLAMSISNYTYVLETGRIDKHGPSSELLQDDYIRKAYLGI